MKELYLSFTHSSSSMILLIVRFVTELYFSSTHKKSGKSKFPNFNSSCFQYPRCRLRPRFHVSSTHITIDHRSTHNRFTNTDNLSPDTVPHMPLLTIYPDTRIETPVLKKKVGFCRWAACGTVHWFSSRMAKNQSEMRWTSRLGSQRQDVGFS